MNPVDKTDPGYSQVARNHTAFSDVTNLSAQYLARGLYEAAAVCAQIAASHAFVNHCGIFASSHLEELLRTIGSKTIRRSGSQTRRAAEGDGRKHLLHVLNAGRPTGGDTRYVWRWMQEDAASRHSVVLTRQRTTEVPQVLSDAVVNTGGRIHVLDRNLKELIAQAQELRTVAESVDLIALHIFPDDVIPLIAFADKRGLPPIVYINHSDHTFWLGVGISDKIANLRECSLALSEKRRGIPVAKNAFLPTPLGAKCRCLSPAEAKRKLGYDENTIVILTIATEFKYESIGGLGFTDIIVPVLMKHKNCILLAIGPDDSEQWRQARVKTEGRVVTMGRRSDTDAFYEAADIYLDSFPFASITSMLEAGSHGLPVVNYCAFADEAKVLSSGAPGLSGAMFSAATVEEYEQILTELIQDKDYRVNKGALTARQIEKFHRGNGWNSLLQQLYIDACEGVYTELPQADIGMRVENIDILLSRLYSSQSHIGSKISHYANHLPYILRLRLLSRLLAHSRSFSFSLFLPRWLEKRVSGHLGWWRNMPGVARWVNSRL